MSTNALAPRTEPVVTAIIVAHDGARLLPALVKALKAQTYPVTQTVGVDTASRDRSGAVLAELIGQDAVFGMNRSTGFGEAVSTALRSVQRRRTSLSDPSEWIWLLHDDCEPAPDALDKLLRAAGRDRAVVVVGPKVVDAQDRRTLREAGISIDRAGRRVTGIDPGEIDQGQHDHKRAVLAVGSAGMLVRRDVWERLGGFDQNLKLFRDDVDFCWRVQAAGLRVHVATDAILYHWELAGRRRRDAQDSSVRIMDRRNAMYVLAVNLPLLPMLWILGGCVLGSLARAFYFLLTKQLDLSAAYAFSVAGLFAHPVKLLKGRRRRARGLAEGYSAVRLFIPPARTLNHLAEQVAGLIGNGPPQASGGRHQATVDESEEDAQFVEQPSVLRRVAGHPGVQLFLVLLLVALIATRRLLGTNPLGGGALVPAWGGASALWQEYLAGFHAVSLGSSAPAPPYLAVVASLATLLGGQAWLAVDVLLLGCVPLAGATAYYATRQVVTATPARVLLAASYALLPVATGAVAAGRLGTAVAFILLPLIAVSAGRMLTAGPRQARRAAWATGLLVGLAAAFAPFTWVLAVVFALGALGVRRWLTAVTPLNAAIVALTPFFVLFPWSLHLLGSPSNFLVEAGLTAQGLTTHGLGATALLALSPGGPGVPPAWVTLGFALALAALVLPARRLPVVIAGWSVAIAGLLAAVLLSRVSVTPPTGGESADGWPGVAIALAALGLLIASAPAAQWLTTIILNGSPGLSSAPAAPVRGQRLRRLLAAAALLGAATAPLLVAAYWVKDGVRGPVAPVTAPLLPAFVSASSTSAAQYRTLILRTDGAGLDYQVVRQADPSLGQPELAIPAAAAAALSRQVAALGAPDGADAGDPGLVLGSFGIKWVLLPGPVDPALASRLDAALGLVALNNGPSYDLWQVTGPVSRVTVVAPSGAVTALSSGPVNLTGVTAPASGGTLILAEPYGGWTATLNGQALKPVATPVDGWAQGFVLPPGGGTLAITRGDLARPLSLILELLATLAVLVLALPGKRTASPSLSASASAEEAAPAAALDALHEGPVVKAGAPGRHATGAAEQAATSLMPAAPWDRATPGGMAGDWDNPAQAAARRTGQHTAITSTPDLSSWSADPVDTPAQQPPKQQEAGRLSDADWLESLIHEGEQAREDAPAQDDTLAGDDKWAFEDATPPQTPGPSQTPAVPETPAAPPASWETDPLDTSKPFTGPGWQDAAESRLPWETASRAPWESGPQTPVPGTGAQRRPPWESGPQAPVAPADAQPGSRTGAQPVSRADARGEWRTDAKSAWGTGALPAARTGAQPTFTPTGPQPAFPTGPQPSFTPAAAAQPTFTPTGEQPTFTPTGEHPVSRSGAQPVRRAPWESGDLGRAPDYAPLPADGGAGPADRDAAAVAPEPATGSGGWPTTSSTASETAKPERHSHRGGKHGKPSRWRGSGNRSTEDGES